MDPQNQQKVQRSESQILYGRKITTINEFIIQEQSEQNNASGELTQLVAEFMVACKVVNREVNRAGLNDVLGSYGGKNVQGEVVQKLDIYANELIKDSLKISGLVAGVASEEDEDFIKFKTSRAQKSNYCLVMDPLDGSSNTDVNVSIGTIFAFYKVQNPKLGLQKSDFLQKGTKMVVGGYVVYGSSTILVYTSGKSVNAFTLDPSIGEFCLSHKNIQTPKNGKIYSVNEGYYNSFSKGIQAYLNLCKSNNNSSGKPYKSRYIGSLVADFHRNLLKGGIYLYPATHDNPNGKLRLLYECNPLSWIAEIAGGKAYAGYGQRVLDLKPQYIHQRIPFFIGSANMVDQLLNYVKLNHQKIGKIQKEQS